MSKVNRESVEDQNLDDNSEPDIQQKAINLSSSNSGSVSSNSSSCSSSRSILSSSSTSTSSNDGRKDDKCLSSQLNDEQQSKKSNKVEHENISGLRPSSSLFNSDDAKGSQVIERLQQVESKKEDNVTTKLAPSPQNCDINKCPTTSILLDNETISSERLKLKLKSSTDLCLLQEESNYVGPSIETDKLKIQPKQLERNDSLKAQNLLTHINPPYSPTSLGSSYSNLCSTTTSTLEPSLSGNKNESILSLTNEAELIASTKTPKSELSTRRILKPAPSPSPSLSIIDTNNNKNKQDSTSLLSSLKRNNFSKSASGSRLMIKSNRSNVCDCLTPDCGEKKHSNRRQFIEHYYNSRTQLPSATSTSSFNISTPLNRLSECDAITKRLLSSPIRTTTTINQLESPIRRVQISEVDKSRRASLGTNTITDQIFLFSSPQQTTSSKLTADHVVEGESSNAFKSWELGFNNNTNKPSSSLFKKFDNQERERDGEELEKQNDRCDRNIAVQYNNQKQQQGRSLSVCDEETLNPRSRGIGSDHSSNLNRAISLACESRSSSSTQASSRRFLTVIPLFGCDIKSLEQFNKLGLILPPIIDSIVDYILINGINSIGIFRKSGVKSRILTLKQRIESNQNVKFKELNQNNEFSIYDIADLVKMWFRELRPLPLLTRELIKMISLFLASCKQQQLKQIEPNLKIKINSITTLTHRALLAKALELLEQISLKWETNQMTSQNLAICLTPSLCETESDQSSILLAQKALEFCIENHRRILELD